MLQVETLKLGPVLISPQVFSDNRGFFKETYKKSLYNAHGITCDFVQDNHSFSLQNTLRGMHFQKKPGQAKLVFVVKGTIFDVMVDIRKNSPTFGKWEGVYLDGEKGQQLFIPIGFAHGFCVVSDEAHVVYKVSHPYDASEECTFRFDDPFVGIQWPVSSPLLSSRDQNSPFLKEIVS